MTKKEQHQIEKSKEVKKRNMLKIRSLQYLEEAKNNISTILSNFEDLLPNRNNLTKADLIPLFKNNFFRTYKVRALLNQNSKVFLDHSHYEDDDCEMDHSKLAGLGNNRKELRLNKKSKSKEIILEDVD